MKLRALHHTMRQRIIEFIEEEEPTVTEITIHLREEQAVVSQHLVILRRQKILLTRRSGKFVHYHINSKEMDRIIPIISQLAEGVEYPSPFKREYDRSNF